MKKTVSLIFPTRKALDDFRNTIVQPNCVAIGTLLSCDLTEDQVNLAKEYGGRILADSERNNRAFSAADFV